MTGFDLALAGDHEPSHREHGEGRGAGIGKHTLVEQLGDAEHHEDAAAPRGPEKNDMEWKDHLGKHAFFAKDFMTTLAPGDDEAPVRSDGTSEHAAGAPSTHELVRRSERPFMAAGDVR